MAKVSKGRVVLVTLRENGKLKPFNGDAEHPAVITAAWSDDCINARVMVDSSENPLWVTSVPRADTVADDYGYHTWRWPPREEE